MLTKQDLDFLRGLSVFAGLSDPVISHVGDKAVRLDFDTDQLLYREGEPAKEMVVVLHGHLDVLKRAESGAKVRIATLGPGDVGGEMSLLDIQPRSADVWARAPASVVVLGHADLAWIYREDKQSYALLVLNIAREVSIRLRRLDALVANVMGAIETSSPHLEPQTNQDHRT